MRPRRKPSMLDGTSKDLRSFVQSRADGGGTISKRKNSPGPKSANKFYWECQGLKVAEPRNGQSGRKVKCS